MLVCIFNLWSNPDITAQGFKYIGNTALDLVAQGLEVRMSPLHFNLIFGLISLIKFHKVPFGYEEAIGFMFGSKIRDKDGVVATVRPPSNRAVTPRSYLYRSQLVFAEIVASLHRSGQTVRGFLDELYQIYGYFQVNHVDTTASQNPEHLSDE